MCIRCLGTDISRNTPVQVPMLKALMLCVHKEHTHSTCKPFTVQYLTWKHKTEHQLGPNFKTRARMSLIPLWGQNIFLIHAQTLSTAQIKHKHALSEIFWRFSIHLIETEWLSPTTRPLTHVHSPRCSNGPSFCHFIEISAKFRPENVVRRRSNVFYSHSYVHSHTHSRRLTNNGGFALGTPRTHREKQPKSRGLSKKNGSHLEMITCP